MKTRTFVDHVKAHARAGKGGDGSCSFRREACVPEGGPDGGDGGRGGHVIFKGNRDTDSLIALYFAPQLFAEDGVAGRGQKMYGRVGKDLVVPVPCGTEIFDAETGVLMADIVEHGQEVVLAKGGKGGLGNVHFRTSTHQVPTEHTPGDAGGEFRLRLELKTIADAGLLGVPNAGNSSLLACFCEARPKIASYPFTTLNPIVGTLQYPDFSQLRMADVPGIIEGASDGVGLGIDFLKHIARSRVLVYVIDMAGTDNRQPWDDYLKLRHEISQYDAALLDLLEFVRRENVEALVEHLVTDARCSAALGTLGAPGIVAGLRLRQAQNAARKEKEKEREEKRRKAGGGAGGKKSKNAALSASPSSSRNRPSSRCSVLM